MLLGLALSGSIGYLAWSWKGGLIPGPPLTNSAQFGMFMAVFWPEGPFGILLLVLGAALYSGVRKAA